MMIFENVRLNNGDDWPDRWHDEDREYSIVRYYYWNKRGDTCTPEDRCDPWYAAYRNVDGRALAGRNVKIESFEEAAGLCMDDKAGRL